MRRREPENPSGWLLSGTRYAIRAEYEAAKAARAERRRRLLAGIEAQREDRE